MRGRLVAVVLEQQYQPPCMGCRRHCDISLRVSHSMEDQNEIIQ